MVVFHFRFFVTKLLDNLQEKATSGTAFFIKAAKDRKGGVTRDDSQRRASAQHNITALLRHCFEWLQHCSNIAKLCCAENRRCRSSRVTSP